MASAEGKAAMSVARWITKSNKHDHPNLIFISSPDDEGLVSFFMVVFGSGKHRGGEYIFKLTAPKDFPSKPPSFRCLTPNSSFSTKEPRLCISIGEFHTDDRSGDGAKGWRPALGLYGFGTSAYNGLVCPESLQYGIGIIVNQKPEGSPEDSAAYNKKHNAVLRERFKKAAEGLKAGETWLQYKNQEKFSEPEGSLGDAKVLSTFAKAYGKKIFDEMQEAFQQWNVSSAMMVQRFRKLGKDFRDSRLSSPSDYLALFAIDCIEQHEPESDTRTDPDKADSSETTPWDMLCKYMSAVKDFKFCQKIKSQTLTGTPEVRKQIAEKLREALFAALDQNFEARDSALNDCANI